MSPTELRSYRKKKKMTQAEFATWLPATKRAVVAWETGQNPVPAWVQSKVEGESFKLNPKLSYEEFVQAQEVAASKNMTMEEWIADLIKKDLSNDPTTALADTSKKRVR